METHETKTKQGPEIMLGLPDGTNFTPSKEFRLKLRQLPNAAREAQMIPGFTYSLLKYVDKFCNASCTTFFDNEELTIKQKGKNVLIGKRNIVQDCGISH